MDEDTLATLREKARGLRSETMQERKGREKQVRMRDDGRANRTRQPVETFTVGLPPGTRGRVALHCRRRGVLIKDFVLECLEEGLAKHGGE